MSDEIRRHSPQGRLERLQKWLAAYPEIEPNVRAAEIEFEQGENPDHLEIKLLLAEKALDHAIATPAVVEKVNRIDSATALSETDIDASLQRSNGVRKIAADELGLSEKQLYNRINGSPYLRERWPSRKNRKS